LVSLDLGKYQTGLGVSKPFIAILLVECPSRTCFTNCRENPSFENGNFAVHCTLYLWATLWHSYN